MILKYVYSFFLHKKKTTLSKLTDFILDENRLCNALVIKENLALAEGIGTLYFKFKPLYICCTI